jgi:hypothetical protein
MAKGAFLFWLGLIAIVNCGIPLSLLYAFASMVPPDLEGWDYWWLVTNKMFSFSDGGVLSTMAAAGVVAGLTLVVWGSCMFARDLLSVIWRWKANGDR